MDEQIDFSFNEKTNQSAGLNSCGSAINLRVTVEIDQLNGSMCSILTRNRIQSSLLADAFRFFLVNNATLFRALYLRLALLSHAHRALFKINESVTNNSGILGVQRYKR